MSNYIRVASIMPKIEVGNIEYNTKNIIEDLRQLSLEKVKIAVLSELSITSNSLSSLYKDEDILNDSFKALMLIANNTNNSDMLIFATIPYKYENKVYEVCAVIHNGMIVALTPIKSDNNAFSYSDDINTKISYYDNLTNSIIEVPVISNININIDNLKDFSVQISSLLSLDKKYNSTILINPSSISESIYIEDKINRLKLFSKENNIALINANPSITESSANNIYYSRSYIIECGEIIARNDNFSKNYIIADIDIDHINATKTNTNNHVIDNPYAKNTINNTIQLQFNYLENYPIDMEMYRKFDETPYIIKTVNRYQFSMHIINMLAVALNKRLQAIKTNKIVLGLSGGLDSTICLFIINRCAELSNLSKSNLIVVTMPCFGTTNNSLNIAKELAAGFGIELRNINIKESVIKHFNDISHDINNINSAYENAQARERTQVLMDIANDVNGIVIGTGDMSEEALGFCTYNGDHMSMYNLISSVPKTMIKYILQSISMEYKNKNINQQLSNAIDMLLNSPISPELLPTTDGEAVQYTEKIVGDYILNDFFLFNYLNYNYGIEKIYDLSVRTFNNSSNYQFSESYIKNCLNNFFDRFYKAQYKRNASPDSPSIGLKTLDSHHSFYAPGDMNICKKII